MAQSTGADWANEAALARKLRKHGSEVDADTVDDYAASAWETKMHGRRFEYQDRGLGEPRVGYYDPNTELFTALD